MKKRKKLKAYYSAKFNEIILFSNDLGGSSMSSSLAAMWNISFEKLKKYGPKKCGLIELGDL